MVSETEDLREHLERFRAVTLQVVEIVSDAELAWRPDENSFSIPDLQSEQPVVNCTTCHRGQVTPALNLPAP